MPELANLQKILGIKFKNTNILRQAMVHRSYLNEHPEFAGGHNERLEFLGDAVLEIVVTEHLYLNYPDMPEGDLTNWRAALVNAKMLYVIAMEIGLEDYLYLSRGEAKDKDKKSRHYILANAVESLIGAIYLDQGLPRAKKFISDRIITKLPEILKTQAYLDPKSRFQEQAQEKRGVTPRYDILAEEGPDHAKLFTVGLYLTDELIATGQGSSKQEAQVDAAAKGLKLLNW
ncbi:ribonuclease III [Candidatus Falkowbacteria bacterium HGW-Falkowbacteria-2]|uniref:Ribonuclease 3 n=1 Tax=Candidatus Falkowbacteria bacterium HGW-Falkowbacteria-2 TaxID=2013769 RepID=A0A2N2E075_9BACT|nr:MAG: ribonuclease III [Candidatus Falkowbacteria bacterium HGW-Falkowbacteria-2]